MRFSSFTSSADGRTAAFYPSPVGATESLLPADTWVEVMAANPLFASLEPDVEALLLLVVSRTREPRPVRAGPHLRAGAVAVAVRGGAGRG